MYFKKPTLCSFMLFLAAILLTTQNLAAQQFEYPDSWSDQGMTLDAQSRSNVSISYSITDFSIIEETINGRQMQNILLPGTFLPNDEGMPNLPGASRFIAIPNGAKAVLKVTDFRTEKIQDVDIAPAPRIPLETEDGLYFEKNEKTYSTDAFYPAEPVTISEVTNIRGVDAVMVGITPYQYNPVTKELIVYRDIKLEVNFEGGDGNFGRDRLRSPWFDPIHQDVFLNSASLPKIDYNKRRNDLMTSKETGCEYLIVVPNGPDFMQWADSIKSFRQQQGILTEIVTLADIGGTTPAQLETYFNNAYNNWDIPPVAVLLLADYGSNASNSITSPIYDNYCVSDNVFADVSGNHMPDIVFARITANNASQLQVMVTKFLNYERTPPTNPGFYHSPITALGWQTERWFQICSETVGGFWRNQGKDPVRINEIYQGSPGTIWSSATNTSTVVNYFGPSGLGYIPATPAELGGWSGGTAAMVNNAINNGAFMLQHRDHGYELGWGEPGYSNTNINSLTNTDLTFVFSINCLTGKYNYGSECFTEKFHRHTSGGNNSGALGLIGASETSYSFVNDAFVWGMFDNMYPEFLPDYGMPVDERGLLPAFGNASGKYFLQQSSWPYNVNNKQVTYHLFHHHGDAFLNVYSEVPQQLSVNHEATVVTGAAEFTVTADDGSFIALTVNNEIIGTGYGTGQPVAISIIPQQPPVNILVTVTKQNYYRHSSQALVIAPDGPYVVVESYEIDDANGNGKMEYGETINLNMTLKNVGIEVAENVEATLASNDEFVTITSATSAFGNIDPDATITVNAAFVFDVSQDIPNNHNVIFQITMTDGVDAWESSFTLKGYAPVIEIPSIVVDDPNGNNNGRLDPGESANLVISVANTGGSPVWDFSASLAAINPFVTVNSGATNFEILPEEGTIEAEFSVTVSPAAPIGSIAEMLLEIESSIFQFQENLSLKIGMVVEDFETGDFSAFDWTFGGNGPWTITNISPYEGTYSAKSGTISHYQSSVMQLSMEVAADDEISFHYKVSSESGYDFLKFYIDNEEMDSWSGAVPWSVVTYPVEAGQHVFKWTYVKDQSVSNGSDCGWVDFIELPAPVDETLVAWAGNDETICEGTVFTCGAFANNYETLLWETAGDGTFSDITILNPVYTPGTQDYLNGSVLLTLHASANGNTVSDDILLSFDPLPLICETPTGETNLCIGNEPTDYTTTGAANAEDYLWQLTPAEAGELTFTGSSANIVWNESWTGVAQLTVYGINYCGNGEISEALNIMINDLPAVPTQPQGENDFCIGVQTTTYQTTEAAYADDYMWELLPAEAGTLLANGLSAEVTWAEGYAGQAEVHVKSVNNCGESGFSDALGITIHPMPEVPAQPAGELSLCEDNANTTYTVQEAANADDYTWELLPAEAGTITSAGVTAEVQWTTGFSGEAMVHVKAINDCGESEFSEALTLNIAPKPDAAGIVTGKAEVCLETTETFMVPEIVHATSAEWIIEPAEAGTLTPNGISCDITFNGPWVGTAIIKVRGMNDCGYGEWSQGFSLLVEDCTGITENENNTLRIYPNPNTGVFTLNLSGQDVVSISLVNALGKVVYHEQEVRINGSFSKSIQTNGLSQGVYYLTINGITLNKTEKIVIRK